MAEAPSPSREPVATCIPPMVSPAASSSEALSSPSAPMRLVTRAHLPATRSRSASRSRPRLTDMPSCPLPKPAPRRVCKTRHRSVSVSARRGRTRFTGNSKKPPKRGYAPSRPRTDKTDTPAVRRFVAAGRRARSPSPMRLN